jgi:hypothetical protein
MAGNYAANLYIAPTTQKCSGQKTVSSAGTAVKIETDLEINGPVILKALDTNTGVVSVGNDGAGDVTVSNGLRLQAGDVVVLNYVSNLNRLWLDSAVNGEGISWLALNV